MPTPDLSDRAALISALENNWRAEKAGAATYRELSKLERNDRRAAVLLRLAEAEERHADRWAQRIVELAAQCPRMESTDRSKRYLPQRGAGAWKSPSGPSRRRKSGT